MEPCPCRAGSGGSRSSPGTVQGSPQTHPRLELEMGPGVGMEALPSPCLLGLAPFPTCLGTIWCLLYLFCCGSGRRAGFHCLREEVGRRTGTCPCPAGCPEPGAPRAAGHQPPHGAAPKPDGGEVRGGAGCRPSTLAAAELSTPERGEGWGRNAWQRRPDSSQPGSAAATGMLGEPSTEK